jgi:hypothetical protein
MNPLVVTLVLRLLVGCYGYMLVMASANIASCEIRRPGQCGNQWTQAFTVAGGAASTMWAFITDSPSQISATNEGRRGRRNAPPSA